MPITLVLFSLNRMEVMYRKLITSLILCVSLTACKTTEHAETVKAQTQAAIAHLADSIKPTKDEVAQAKNWCEIFKEAVQQAQESGADESREATAEEVQSAKETMQACEALPK